MTKSGSGAGQTFKTDPMKALSLGNCPKMVFAELGARLGQHGFR